MTTKHLATVISHSAPFCVLPTNDQILLNEQFYFLIVYSTKVS